MQITIMKCRRCGWPDVQKAAGGNKAAGTRVRKVMQEVRETAKQLRADILDAQKTD